MTMMKHTNERGFTLVEMLVGLVVAGLVGIAMATVLLQNSRINRSQQMFTAVQNNARSSMDLVVSRLRSAGWDPMNANIAVVATDPDPLDDVSQIEMFADLDEDKQTLSDGEQVTIRHIDDRIEWRLNGDASSPYQVVATGITNDADGDGVIEPMFQPDDPADPAVITVQITARSPVPDPRNGKFIRYTLKNEVTLRKGL
jgi:prepilin-type N-terminal cleavage/methylation domain-containing protein